MRLLISQSQRCRDILAKLTQPSADGGGPSFHLLPFMTMVEMAAAAARHGHLEVGVEHDPALAGDDDRGREARGGRTLPQPVVPHSLEIIHGLENLIENAVDFARARVGVKVGWSERKVVVEVTDDGPGFAYDILGALGEPYVSTRQDAGGMGLGVFIAKTLLERSGGEIEFGNRKGGGARIVVVWPRTAFAEELWIGDQAPAAGPLAAKTRYRQADVACNYRSASDQQFSLGFSTPQWAVTPGQSAVLYDGDICLGGNCFIKSTSF